MSKLDEIRSLGYTFTPGFLLGDEILPTNNDESHFNKYHLVITTPDGKKRSFTGLLDAPATIGGIKTTRREIIQDIFNPTSDEWAFFENGYSVRTKKYLDAVNKNAGVLSFSVFDDFVTDANLMEFETIERHSVDFSTEIEVGKCENGFVARYSLRHNTDSFSTTQIIFDHKPSRKDLLTAINVDKMSNRLFTHKETYTCRECGREVHWLDVDGNFEEKMQFYEERYCGC